MLPANGVVDAALMVEKRAHFTESLNGRWNVYTKVNGVGELGEYCKNDTHLFWCTLSITVVGVIIIVDVVVAVVRVASKTMFSPDTIQLYA